MIPQKKANPIYNALAVFLLLSGAVLFISGPMIPKARASGPTVNAASGVYSQSGLPTVVFSVVYTTVGDLAVITISWNGGGACPSPDISSITDTAGTAWQQVASQYCLPINNGSQTLASSVEIWDATVVATGIKSVTVTFASNTAAGSVGLSFYDVTGASTALVHTATGNQRAVCGSSPCSYSLNSTIAYNAPAFMVGVGEWRSTGNSGTAAAGASLGLPTGCCVNDGAMGEYATSSGGPSSPTNMPWSLIFGSGQAKGMVEEAAAFGGPDVVVTTVVACTFFQLQCWWYPMLMFGVGLAPFALVGALGKVNARGMTYLMLFGLTMTSLVEVLMGMINAMLPLGLTVLTIVYLVRIRL